jgi:hypothetical protein
MLYVFHLDVVYVARLYTYVANVCFKYFIYFRRMLQMFYLDVGFVSLAMHIGCKLLFKMFYPF